MLGVTCNFNPANVVIQSTIDNKQMKGYGFKNYF